MIPRDGERTPGGYLIKAGSLTAAAFAAMPLFACGTLLNASPGLLRWMAVPFVSLAASLLALLVSAKKIRGLTPLTLLAAAAVSFPLAGGGWQGAIAAAAAAALCFAFLSRRALPPGNEWGVSFWLSGLIWQLILWALFGMGLILGESDGPAAAGYCAAGSSAYMLLYLLSLNRDALSSGSHSDITGKQVSPRIRFRNRCAVGLLFVLSAAAGFSKKLVEAARVLWDLILSAVGAAVEFFLSLFPSMTSPSAGGTGGREGGLFGMEEASEPSLLSRILEKAAMVLAAAATLFLLFLLIRAATRLVKTLYRRLMDKISRMAELADEDYTETVDDTRKDRGDEETVRRGGRIAPQRRPTTGGELVRSLYRRFLRRYPEKKGLTCREALKGTAEEKLFTSLYERARYSGHEVSMAESEALEEKIKKEGFVKHV